MNSDLIIENLSNEFAVEQGQVYEVVRVIDGLKTVEMIQLMLENRWQSSLECMIRFDPNLIRVSFNEHGNV